MIQKEIQSKQFRTTVNLVKNDDCMVLCIFKWSFSITDPLQVFMGKIVRYMGFTKKTKQNKKKNRKKGGEDMEAT